MVSHTGAAGTVVAGDVVAGAVVATAVVTAAVVAGFVAAVDAELPDDELPHPATTARATTNTTLLNRFMEPTIPLSARQGYGRNVNWHQLVEGVDLPFHPDLKVPALTEVHLPVPTPEPVADVRAAAHADVVARLAGSVTKGMTVDRKSTRLNSSHIPLSRMPSSA